MSGGVLSTFSFSSTLVVPLTLLFLNEVDVDDNKDEEEANDSFSS